MSRTKGNEAEDKACEYLLSNGFTIDQKNFYAKNLGEIDIIARYGGTYHFIEVKSGMTYEQAIQNITASKLKKIKQSIDYYLNLNRLSPVYCIDAIIVSDQTVELIENITV